MSNKKDEYWNYAVDLYEELTDELVSFSVYLEDENAENIQNINNKLLELKKLIEDGIETLINE